jgi:hypothetical protein
VQFEVVAEPRTAVDGPIGWPDDLDAQIVELEARWIRSFPRRSPSSGTPAAAPQRLIRHHQIEGSTDVGLECRACAAQV